MFLKIPLHNLFSDVSSTLAMRDHLFCLSTVYIKFTYSPKIFINSLAYVFVVRLIGCIKYWYCFCLPIEFEYNICIYASSPRQNNNGFLYLFFLKHSVYRPHTLSALKSHVQNSFFFHSSSTHILFMRFFSLSVGCFILWIFFEQWAPKDLTNAKYSYLSCNKMKIFGIFVYINRKKIARIFIWRW